MAIDTQVAVIDVNGSPLVGATVSLANGSRNSTDAQGICKFPAVDVSALLNISVSHPYFVSELTLFESDPLTSAWDNPLMTRSATNASLAVTFQLRRCNTAPVVERTDPELQDLAHRGADIHGALLFHPNRFPKLRSYRLQYNDIRDIRVSRSALLPPPPYESLAPGWARFQSDPATVDLAALGRFYWIEYPAQPSDPKYAVAVWSPNLSATTPVSALDYVVFFSPTTAGYTATYPYGLTRDYSPPDQSYMTLGTKYLIDEYFFAYQLLARRNSSVLVMPICKRGDWGPFATSEGILRMLREISAFLHRRSRTSQLGVFPPSADPDSLAGADPLAHSQQRFQTSFGQIPSVGQVVVAGFSKGIDPVKKLMNPANWPVNLANAFWGIPVTSRSADGSLSPSEQWTKAWRELWDLDGFHPDTGGWPKYLDLLGNWYSSDRIVRLCHSQGRVPPNPLDAKAHPVYKRMIKEGITLQQAVPLTQNVGWADELHGQRWSVVRLSESYITNPHPTTDAPRIDEAHHSTPRVGFSHASSMMTVGQSSASTGSGKPP